MPIPSEDSACLRCLARHAVSERRGQELNMRREDVFSLLEVMFATFIGFVALTALLGLVAASAKASATSQYVTLDTAFGNMLVHISEPTRLGMISYAVFC